MSKVIRWIKTEIIHAIPAFLFFVIAFNLINLTERLMLRSEEISGFTISYFTATISALVVVKVLIIVNSFPFINAFPKKPLIYNITWKFIIYAFATLFFRIAETFIHAFIKQEDFGIAYTHIQQKLTSPFFWAIQMWLLMLFFVYIIADEFTRVLGKEKIMQLLFGKNTQHHLL